MKITVSADSVRISVVPSMNAAWNQEAAWSDIVKVCFKDEGIYRSDIVFLTVRGRAKPVVVLLEADGAEAFMRKLAALKLFPNEILLRAKRSTDGGLYCWPPE